MDFDWALAIKRNSEALKGIVAALFAMLGLDGEATVGRIPQPLHRAVLRVLWPAESAMRRLIIIAARSLVVKLPAARPISRPMPAGPIGKGGHSPPSFQLFDPRKNFARKRRRKFMRNPPRIHFYPYDTLRPPHPPAADAPPPSDGLVNAERLSRRLQALKLALEDLPRQARRLARWRVRREKAKNPKSRSPLRPGRPPCPAGSRFTKSTRVLAECHWLAWDAMKPDTS